MPDMTRTYIKRYLRTLLRQANTLAGENVHWNRPVNYDLAQKQAEIRILSLNSTSKTITDSPRIYEDTYYATIEMAYAPDLSNYDQGEENFEIMVAAVQNAIETDQFLEDKEIMRLAKVPASFCVQETILKGIDYRTEAEANTPLYVGTIAYEVCYNRKVGVPVEPLENLERVVSEISPSEGSESTPEFGSSVEV